LDFKNGLVEQLKIENTKKWRVEERNDWKALVDSVQKDRDEVGFKLLHQVHGGAHFRLRKLAFATG